MQHQKLYPNYKFQPVRKEEKLAQRAERAKERDERRREKELFRQRQRRRMRRGMSPHDHDEGHVVSMSRSSSYPGPEGSSYHVSYGAGCEYLVLVARKPDSLVFRNVSQICFSLIFY